MTNKEDTIESSPEATTYETTDDYEDNFPSDYGYDGHDDDTTDTDSVELELVLEITNEECKQKCMEIIAKYEAPFKNYDKVVEEYKAKYIDGEPPFPIKLKWTVELLPEIKKYRLPSVIKSEQNPPKSYWEQFYDWLFCQDTIKETIVPH